MGFDPSSKYYADPRSVLGQKENHGPGDGTEQDVTEQLSATQPNYPCGDEHEDDQLRLTFLSKIMCDYINVLLPYIPVMPT